MPADGAVVDDEEIKEEVKKEGDVEVELEVTTITVAHQNTKTRNEKQLAICSEYDLDFTACFMP